MSPDPERQHTTLRIAISEFLAERQSRRRSPRTINNYRRELDRFVSYTGDPPIESITPAAIRAYLDKLSLTRNAGGVFTAYRIIRALFSLV